MPDDLLRVFVSSASGHLRTYRDAVIDVISRLGMHPVYQEIFPAADPPPVEVCRKKVDECDALVLLLAHRYGSRPPGDPRCYTEVEYDHAQETGKPVLAFIVGDDQLWLPAEIDQGADAESLKAFKAKASKHTRGTFGTVEDLRGKVYAALHPLERELAARWPEVKPKVEARAELSRRLRAPAMAAFPHYIGGAAEFTGRHNELDELSAWLNTGGKPVHVLHAIGGTGKSALAWDWFCSLEGNTDIAGLFWWSFYDGSASVTSLCQDFLRYSQGLAESDLESMSRNDLLNEVRNQLSSDHYVVVLDGVERLCAAYHRIDPTKVVDEEADDGQLSTNRLIDPSAYDLFTAMLSLRSSKVLVTTRVMPDAFLTPANLYWAGLAVTRLPGLRPDDAVAMVRRLGIQGSEPAIRAYFAQLDHHPLTISLISGIVLNNRTKPRDFDGWLSSIRQTGTFALHKLDLVARRTHILKASLDGLPPDELVVLQALSVLEEPASWELVTELNPHRPDPPAPVEPDLSSLGDRPDQPWLPEGPARDTGWATVRAWDRQAVQLREAAAEETRRQRLTWDVSPTVIEAAARLDRHLADLEQRGLVWWDRDRNTYDMHPVVRSHVYADVDEARRQLANNRVIACFASYKAPLPAATMDDLGPTLILFRALVKTRRVRGAAHLYRASLENVLVQLGANDIIIELLTSAEFDDSGIRTALANAYSDIDRESDATEIYRDLLERELDRPPGRRRGIEIMVWINNLINSYQGLGRLRAAHQGIDLLGRLVDATGRLDGDLARLKSLQVEQALRLGDYDGARRLLTEIDALPPSPTALFHWDSRRVDQLDLAIGEVEAQGESLPPLSAFAGGSPTTVATFADLLQTFESWRCSTACCSLWVRHAIHRRDWHDVLDAANAWGARLRAGGCEAIPAEAVIALADAALGHQVEAQERLTAVLAALPRLAKHLRPYVDIAHTQLLLGDSDSGQSHLLIALEIAQREGPNFTRVDDCRRIHSLWQGPVEELTVTESKPATRDSFPLSELIERHIDFYLKPDLSGLSEWLSWISTHTDEIPSSDHWAPGGPRRTPEPAQPAG